MHQSLATTRELEVENQKLRKTIEEYRQEFADVKSQEVTINRLKDRVKQLEDSQEDLVAARVRERERQVRRHIHMKNKQTKKKNNKKTTSGE